MGFFFFGLLAVTAGFVVCRCHRETVGSSESFSGEVVSVKEKTVMRGGFIIKKYCPVVKFSINGKTQFADHRSYSQIIHHSTGETVIICADPKMPKYFYFADEEKTHSLAGSILIAGGAFICLLSLVFSLI